MLFLAGECRFVTHGSHAEQEFLSAGAVHVGIVRFDRAPSRQTAGGIRWLAAEELLHAWGSRSC